MRLVESFGEEEYDSHIIRGMYARVVRVLVSDKDAGKLVKSCALAILARISSEVEGELEIRSREMDAREQLLTYGIISRLLGAFPAEDGVLPAKDIRHGLGDRSEVSYVLTRYHE